jgi:hypothetical protein
MSFDIPLVLTGPLRAPRQMLADQEYGSVVDAYTALVDMGEVRESEALLTWALKQDGFTSGMPTVSREALRDTLQGP